MANIKRLGETQKHILKGMAAGRLTGKSWVWTNASTTKRIMKGLVSRGLVTESKFSWDLTEAGQKWVELEDTPTLPEADLNILIVMMAEQDLEWSPSAGWHFKTVQYTELGMRDLEKKGLVRQVGEKKDRRYVAGAMLLDKAYALGYKPELLDE